MDGQKITDKVLYGSAIDWINWFILSLVILSLILILASTLSPFDFLIQDEVSLYEFVVEFFKGFGSPNDLIFNVLLFIPLGFGLAGFIWRQKSKRLLIIIVLTSFLSLVIESLQTLLPGRSTNITDILANVIGGTLGYFLFKLSYIQLLNQLLFLFSKVKSFALLKWLIGIVLSYIICICGVSFVLQSSVNFSNWDPNFPLVLGNEKTGDRPWNGRINKIGIANTVIPDSEIEGIFDEDIASSPEANRKFVSVYQLGSLDKISDQTGYSPDLVWQNKSTPWQTHKNTSLSANHWLITEVPVSQLIQKIRQTSEFTIVTEVATDDINQTGPARIISISVDPYRRNITLGQQGSQLTLRLRTSLSGENGNYPELVFPQVFSTTDFHHLIITYKNSRAKVYIDSTQNFYELKISPEVTIFRDLFSVGNRSLFLTPFNQKNFSSVYYALLFIPLGLLLVMIDLVIARKDKTYFGWVAGLVILPSICLEITLSLAMNEVPEMTNLLHSMAFTCCTFLFVKLLVELKPVPNWILTGEHSNESVAS